MGVPEAVCWLPRVVVDHPFVVVCGCVSMIILAINLAIFCYMYCEMGMSEGVSKAVGIASGCLGLPLSL